MVGARLGRPSVCGLDLTVHTFTSSVTSKPECVPPIARSFWVVHMCAFTKKHIRDHFSQCRMRVDVSFRSDASAPSSMASVPSAISSPDDAYDENTLGFGIKRGYEKASSDRGVPRTGRSLSHLWRIAQAKPQPQPRGATDCHPDTMTSSNRFASLARYSSA
jgi:hypothetical protein